MGILNSVYHFSDLIDNISNKCKLVYSYQIPWVNFRAVSVMMIIILIYYSEVKKKEIKGSIDEMRLTPLNAHIVILLGT